MSSSLSDVCQLFSVSRRTSADLRKAIATYDSEAIHQIWSVSLRKPRKRLLKRQSEQTLLALWSVDSLDLSGRERELAATIEDQLRSGCGQSGNRRRRVQTELPAKRKGRAKSSLFAEVLTNWLVEAAEPLGVWERIAVAEMLLVEHPLLPPELFVRSLALLSSAPARNTDQISCSRIPVSADMSISAGDSKPPLYGPLAEQQSSAAICDSESLWISSLLLEPLASTRHNGKAAAEDLTRTLLECTDPEGLLHGSLLSQATEFLVPLVRSLIWSEVFHKSLWGPKAATRFQQCIRKTSLQVIPGGKLLPLTLTDSATASANNFTIPCLQQAARLAELKPSGKVQRLLADCAEHTDRKQRRQRIRQHTAASGAKGKDKNAVAVSFQSDISSTALIRSQMSATADVAVAEWYSAMPSLSLAAFGVPFLNGAWQWQLQIDGMTVSPSITWNCTCWFTDDEVVFAELEAQDLKGVRLIRHLLLSVIDHFAVLTDSVSCDQAEASVKLQSTIPLDRHWISERDAITRQLSLRTDGLVVRAYPTWLPDDRIVSAAGMFCEQEGVLIADATGRGGVTLPLVLDWNPRRGKASADWSTLTVSESRRNVSAQEAAGVRLRIGKQQWMVYRSLRTAEVARTVLGLHTADESVYGRVLATGIVEPLVQVEPSPEA